MPTTSSIPRASFAPPVPPARTTTGPLTFGSLRVGAHIACRLAATIRPSSPAFTAYELSEARLIAGAVIESLGFGSGQAGVRALAVRGVSPSPAGRIASRRHLRRRSIHRYTVALHARPRSRPQIVRSHSPDHAYRAPALVAIASVREPARTGRSPWRRRTRPPTRRGTSASPRLRSSQLEARARDDLHRPVLASALSPDQPPSCVFCFLPVGDAEGKSWIGHGPPMWRLEHRGRRA